MAALKLACLLFAPPITPRFCRERRGVVEGIYGGAGTPNSSNRGYRYLNMLSKPSVPVVGYFVAGLGVIVELELAGVEHHLDPARQTPTKIK